MANTSASRPAQAGAVSRLRPLWLVLGVLMFVASSPMLVSFAVGGPLAGTMGLASDSGARAWGGVLVLELLLAAGPVLGLGLPALALLSPTVRRADRAALFALFSAGLLAGEYFGRLHPHPG
jgi:hypothetical protein